MRTRWNSDLKMLASMIRLKYGIMSFVHDLKIFMGEDNLTTRNLLICLSNIGF